MACGFHSSKAERLESQREKAKAENVAPPFQKADAPGRVARAVKDAVESAIDHSAYPADGIWVQRSAEDGLRISLAGYAWLALGGQRGFEVNFLSMVAGFDTSRGEVKIPGFGALKLWSSTAH